MTAQCKPWWHSKTIWLNTAVAVVAAVEASTDILKQFMPAEAIGPVLAAVGVLNIALRIATGQPIGKQNKPSVEPAPPVEPASPLGE
jgi:hypothetical protein